MTVDRGDKYKRPIVGLDGVSTTIDLYTIFAAYEVDHEVAHAVKKLIVRDRGHKDRLTDLREAIVSIEALIDRLQRETQ